MSNAIYNVLDLYDCFSMSQLFTIKDVMNKYDVSEKTAKRYISRIRNHLADELVKGVVNPREIVYDKRVGYYMRVYEKGGENQW